MNSVLLFVICTLAVWRISTLLVEEDAPYSALSKLRIWSRRYTDLLDCYLCTSLWVSLPFSLLFPYWFICLFALSAGAILLHRFYEYID